MYIIFSRTRDRLENVMLAVIMTMSSTRSSSLAHSHAEWEIGISLEGSGSYVIGDERAHFLPGSVYLCPPGVKHYREGKRNEQFRDFFIRFNDEGSLKGVGQRFFRDDQDGTLLSLMMIAYKLYNADSVKNGEAINLLVEAICRILIDSKSEEGVSNGVAMLRDEISQCFTDPEFKVVETIERLGYNADYMRRLFKQETGITPTDFLTEKRIENAKKLLSTSRTPEIAISEVAYLSGFYDSNYFTRVFKKVTGVLPTQYRKKSRENNQ